MIRDRSDELSISEALAAEQQLAIDLAEHEDKWVAVADHKIVAVGHTMYDVRWELGEREVESIFQVLPPGPCFFRAASRATERTKAK